MKISKWKVLLSIQSPQLLKIRGKTVNILWKSIRKLTLSTITDNKYQLVTHDTYTTAPFHSCTLSQSHMFFIFAVVEQKIWTNCCKLPFFSKITANSSFKHLYSAQDRESIKSTLRKWCGFLKKRFVILQCWCSSIW